MQVEHGLKGIFKWQSDIYTGFSHWSPLCMHIFFKDVEFEFADQTTFYKMAKNSTINWRGEVITNIKLSLAG